MIPSAVWWVRDWDFPRIQILALSLIVLGSQIIWYSGLWHQWLLSGLLIAALISQLLKIMPFTRLYKKQALTTNQADPDRQIGILIANVLMTNTQTERLHELVNKIKPELLLTLESDINWEQALKPLEKTYPHIVRCPQDNLYGMHLYSRLPLIDPQIRFLIEDGIPSIHTGVLLPSGEKIALYCLHPAPPSPTENQRSSERDAELITVGQTIKKKRTPTIATGDLNDVAWSKTTLLFRKISGLMDPRIGRGLFNSYHANYFFLRWPLDHLFHSNDFTVTRLQRLKHIGSDHFPLYCQLQFCPAATAKQPIIKASSDEKQWAKQKIVEGEKQPSNA